MPKFAIIFGRRCPLGVTSALLFLVASGLLVLHVHAEVPGIINYQGRVVVNGTNFTGTGQFKFALVGPSTNLSRTATATAVRGGVGGTHVVRYTIQDGGTGYVFAPNVVISGGGGSYATAHALIGDGAVTNIAVDNAGVGYTSDPAVTIDPPPPNWLYDTRWSNDGTTSGEPATGVSVTVNKGLYSVLLGQAPMLSISPTVFTNTDVRLRVWFSDGVTGFEQLNPEQRIAAVGYAFIASAVSTGAITGTMLADGAVTAASIAPGAVSTQHLAASVSSAFVQKSGDTMTGPLTVNGDIVGERLKVGMNQTVSGWMATVAGGANNTANGGVAVVAGGWQNQAGENGAVGGGANNSAIGGDATVAGGAWNNASGYRGAVGGGFSNAASNVAATVPGGQNNVAAGQGSLAAGSRAKALHDGTFVWADSTDEDFASVTANQFLIRASSGVGIGTTNPAAGLHVRSGPQWSSWNVGAGVLVDGTRNNGIGLLDATSSNAWAIYNGGGMFHIAQMPQPGDVSSAPNRAMVIATNANVGIGTASPRERLEVAGRILLNGAYGNLDGVDVSWLANSGNTLIGGNKSGGAGESDFIQNRGASASEGGYSFYDLANDGTLNLLMRLKGDGKVGIGTPSPSEQLDVAGAIKLGNTANPSPAAGTIRWTGIDFQGYDGAHWASLTMPAPADMVFVPGGTFTMGCAALSNQWDAMTEHQVTLSSFYLARCEVTYALWYSVRLWGTNNGYRFQNAGREGDDGIIGAAPTAASGEPVTEISWRDSIVWCNARSEREGLTPVYTYTNQVIRDSRNGNYTAVDNAVFNSAGSGYRLPTEAEYEYAARYVDGWSWTPGDFPSGAGFNYSNTVACDAVSWYWENSSNDTHVAGTKKPNQLGLFDMSGNVLSWCWDRFGPYSIDPVTNPVGPSSGSSRIERGGAAAFVSHGLASALRNWTFPSHTAEYEGLRCARNAQ